MHQTNPTPQPFAHCFSGKSAIARQRRLFAGLTHNACRSLLGVMVLFIVLAVHHSPHAATLPEGFMETQIAGGLANPTAMAFAPDGRLFVTEQEGQLRVIKEGELLTQPFLTVEVDSEDERGLLGVAFDPGFSANRHVYIYYTVNSTPRHNRVSRFTADGDRVMPGSETVILELDELSDATRHNGGALHFGQDGKLYIATGENANPPNSQSLANLLGKILRINADGSIPADNPFFDTASGVNRAIWALGLRNPFTFAFQPGTGRMFINDVGEQTWEEINDGTSGANYGWPATEGPTDDARFRSPIFAYRTGSGETEGCAITGGAFYNPAIEQFPSEFVGKYLFADFCNGWIRVLDPANPAEAPFFARDIALPVDLEVGPDASLYYLSRGDSAVYRVSFEDAVQFGLSRYQVSESAGNAVITVARSGSGEGTGTVDYATSDGSAVADSDYTAASGTLTWASGDTAPKTFNVPIINDTAPEADETVNLVLSNPTGGIPLGARDTAVLVIVDDDGGDSGGGGGGGCALDRKAAPDPTLPVLLMASVLYLLRRRCRVEQDRTP